MRLRGYLVGWVRALCTCGRNPTTCGACVVPDPNWASDGASNTLGYDGQVQSPSNPTYIRIAGVGRAAIAAAALTVAAASLAPVYAADGQTADECTVSANVCAIARKYFPSDEQQTSPRRIFRLTRDQIDQTVKFLLPDFHTQSVKEVMAKDPLQTNYEFAELLSFNSANLGPLSGWIKGIAGRVKAKPAGVINCQAQNNAEDCLRDQARAFILKAVRGDLRGEKVEQIVEFYVTAFKASGHAQATADLVELVLSSSHFLFRKEQVDVRRGRPIPEQDLQALTYTLADVPPDRLKLASANALELLQTPTESANTVQTILASKESREKLVRFFKAWLEIAGPGEFTISTEAFPAFTAKLQTAMLEETDRFLRYQLAKPKPKLKDITQSTDGFVSKPLETVYGAKAADPAGAKPVNLDPAKRFGIFSQPALIASHSGPSETRLIKRGVFWVRKAMCMEMEPPPQGLDISLYETKDGTERQKVEDGTQGKACIGCHKVINPFAFFQENYGALGDWRTTDNNQPIDASIKIDFLDEAPVTTRTPVEALKVFTSSAMFKQCFVRQLFRFYMGRNEEPADDALLRRMYVAFAENDEQDILKLVDVLAASDRIKRH